MNQARRFLHSKEIYNKLDVFATDHSKIITIKIGAIKREIFLFLYCIYQVFSDSDSSEVSRESLSEDFSWVTSNPGSVEPRELSSSGDCSSPNLSGENIWRDSRARRESISSVGSSEYATPPGSPAPSSMVTADEGVFLYLHGSEPTQEDRQVGT